jgi:hypothetical protein
MSRLVTSGMVAVRHSATIPFTVGRTDESRPVTPFRARLNLQSDFQRQH